MPEQRLFHAPQLNVNSLGGSLADWFRGQGFDVQLLDAPGGGMVLQARQEEAWRSVLGMSATLNILLRHQQDGNLYVEIGAGKWIDKAAAAGVGMFVLWPMLLTAGYGAWQQGKLPQRTFEFIQNYLASGGSISADMAVMQANRMDEARRVMNAPMAPAAPGMPSPGSPGMAHGNHYPPTPSSHSQSSELPPAETGKGSFDAGEPGVGARFCEECGGKLSSGAKFCPNCGTKLS